MPSSSRLPARFPVGSKYVLEGHGSLVQRFIEFPNGRGVQLPTRKALSCKCAEWQQISITPEQSVAVVDDPSLRRRIVA
jgi:hypothetical protein